MDDYLQNQNDLQQDLFNPLDMQIDDSNRIDFEFKE